MNVDKTEFKQNITKKDVVNILNSMINEKNKNSINKYIDKILTIDDVVFQQELAKHNIQTIEDARRFFETRIAEMEKLRGQAKEAKYLSTASWGKSEPTYETRQLLLALIIKEKTSNKKLKIIDAGAGLGRNSIYLSKNGFNVIAVEYDEGAIEPLKSNIKENNQSDNIQVVNSSILDYLRKQADNSIDALLDSGMSHYLTLEEKKEYFNLLKQKMTKDGLLSITHFSKEDNSAIGLSEDELRALLGKMTELDNIHFDTWVDSISKSSHFAYKGLLIMPNGRSDEIQERYKEIYELISNKKITSIEQIHRYLDGKNITATTQISTSKLGIETLEEQKNTELLDEIEQVQLSQERAITNQREK